MFKIPNQRALLGVNDMLDHKAELALQKRMKELGIFESAAKTQERTALREPIPTFRSAHPTAPAGPGTTDALDFLTHSDYLKRRKK